MCQPAGNDAADGCGVTLVDEAAGVAADAAEAAAAGMALVIHAGEATDAAAIGAAGGAAGEAKGAALGATAACRWKG